jgi:hypothetical protein
MTVTNENLILENIKWRLNYGNACYHSARSTPSSHLLLENIKNREYMTTILPVVLWV